MERFHRIFQTNYRAYISEFAKERDELQRTIIEKAKQLEGSTENLEELTRWAFEEEIKLVERWEKQIPPGKFPFLYGMRWKKVNRKAGLRQDF